jgi:uncharacterized protein YehS (DUF1456 family)
MHIELSQDNADKIRRFSYILDLPSAKIVNILLNELNYEIWNEDIIMRMKKDKIEMLRNHLKLVKEAS